ncbi:C39 family peptidase [Tissierella sp. MB52-C2]|uniref:C39 family peptidase n=1 Tax=Tissierella sp. MB52-C2 TaxID=3070999 RepID=UPI00280B5287|nr:C39 family peptidase [Tissierella sp. MB52-C2]WMM23392.1 C39 family peptidase [Tissierella sp. MB52-C2]
MSSKRSRKRRIVKRKIRQILLIVFALLITYIGYGRAKKLFNVLAISNNKKDLNTNEYAEIEDIPKEVINSNDLTIQNLLKMSKNYPKTNKILRDLSLYPEELLELASQKEEVIDFVADYPNYEPYSNKKISIKKDYEGGKIPLFIQWDKRWGYEKYGSNFIAINGCGPTSLAMVIVGLTGNTDINPKVVADFSEQNGYLVEGVGTSWTLMTEGAKQFGINGKELPLSESVILSTLKKGQPIIASMEPGTFTTTGHFIVLTDVDNNNKIIVNDSDSRKRSKQTWDIDIFMKQTKNLWTFTS